MDTEGIEPSTSCKQLISMQSRRATTVPSAHIYSQLQNSQKLYSSKSPFLPSNNSSTLKKNLVCIRIKYQQIEQVCNSVKEKEHLNWTLRGLNPRPHASNSVRMQSRRATTVPSARDNCGFGDPQKLEFPESPIDTRTMLSFNTETPLRQNVEPERERERKTQGSGPGTLSVHRAPRPEHRDSPGFRIQGCLVSLITRATTSNIHLLYCSHFGSSLNFFSFAFWRHS